MHRSAASHFTVRQQPATSNPPVSHQSAASQTIERAVRHQSGTGQLPGQVTVMHQSGTSGSQSATSQPLPTSNQTAGWQHSTTSQPPVHHQSATNQVTARNRPATSQATVVHQSGTSQALISSMSATSQATVSHRSG
jgi:hypothetical protein